MWIDNLSKNVCRRRVSHSDTFALYSNIPNMAAIYTHTYNVSLAFIEAACVGHSMALVSIIFLERIVFLRKSEFLRCLDLVYLAKSFGFFCPNVPKFFNEHKFNGISQKIPMKSLQYIHNVLKFEIST